MKHTLLLLLALLLCLPIMAQQQTYRARVVDAETGESLPYVYIYMTIMDDFNCNGMVTDAQGYFECSTAPDSVLLFSCVGYEKLSLKAREVKDIVRLKPLVTLMNELTVTPTSARSILEKAASELEKDYEQHKRELSYYKSDITLIGEDLWPEFHRLNPYDSGTIPIGEDSITLEKRGVYFESDCNLRFFYFGGYVFSPNFGSDNYPGDADMLFNYRTHLCKLLRVGPYIKDSKFWNSTITPLGNPKLYVSSYTTLTGTDGQRIYKIDVSRLATNHNSSVQKRTAVLGTLYLDADTYLPLRFEGTVKNLTFKHLPTDLNFQITYHHKNGFAEITQFHLSGKNKKYSFRFSLEYVSTVSKRKKVIPTFTRMRPSKKLPDDVEEWNRKLQLAAEKYWKSIKKTIMRNHLARQRRFVKQRNEFWGKGGVYIYDGVSLKRVNPSDPNSPVVFCNGKYEFKGKRVEIYE